MSNSFIMVIQKKIYKVKGEHMKQISWIKITVFLIIMGMISQWSVGVMAQSLNDDNYETEITKDPVNGGTNQGAGDQQGSDQQPGNDSNSGQQNNAEKLPSTGSNQNEKSLVSKIVISGISKKIAAGKKIALETTVFPDTASNKTLHWSSSNKKIAKVSQNGTVKIKKKTGGKSVTITAAATDGSGIVATYKIKSMKGVVKKVTITGNKTVKAGKSVKLKAAVQATKGANKKLKWFSSNTKYATVSGSGKVKTKKEGKGKKVKITAMATDGSNRKKTIKLNIK